MVQAAVVALLAGSETRHCSASICFSLSLISIFLVDLLCRIHASSCVIIIQPFRYSAHQNKNSFRRMLIDELNSQRQCPFSIFSYFWYACITSRGPSVNHVGKIHHFSSMILDQIFCPVSSVLEPIVIVTSRHDQYGHRSIHAAHHVIIVFFEDSFLNTGTRMGPHGTTKG